ncbi:MAG: hypothetical protein LWW93_08445 [Hyphomicrobiales bacterium]|nr:hypothetical protein [Hyphomicrobiales bacterium]
MAVPRLTRRALLAGLGLAPLAGCMVGGNPPLPFSKVRAVEIDVRPLVERGLPNYAQKVETIGRAALRRAFADALAPSDADAPTVTVVISMIHFAASPSGRREAPFHGGYDDDEATGRLDLAGTSRLLSLSRPLRVTRSPADSGPWYAPDFDDRRLENLLAIFAIRARRELAD